MKGRGNARLFAALLAALWLLGGCADGPQERALVDLSQDEIDAGAAAPTQDGWEERDALATLYFLDAAGERLIPVTREVQVSGGQTLAQAALAALLAGPQEGEDASWPELGNVQAEAWTEFSGEVATVNLPGRARALTPQMLYAVRLAIAGTLTEFPGVSYVNVLVGGREEGLDLGATLPTGTLSRVQDMDVSAQYRRLIELGQDGGFTRLTTLFFPTKDGEHVLASVRSVAYASTSSIDGMYTLLTELGKPDSWAKDGMPAPMDYIVEMPEIVRTEESASRAIELRFSAALGEALKAAGLSRDIYLAMLADTLMDFIPGVEGLLVTIGEERVTALDGEEPFAQGLATRGDFARFTGSPVTLYAPGEQEGKLIAVRCALAQKAQRSPRERLYGLLAQEGELRALPEGIRETDVLAVRVEGDRVLLNLSGAFADALAAMTPERERMAVYAMVNTLTEDGDVRSVTFFFDGEQVASLAGGLEMRGSFVRNPGMVVDQRGSVGAL